MKNDQVKGPEGPVPEGYVRESSGVLRQVRAPESRTPTQLRNERALALVKEMFSDRELAKAFFRMLADRAAVGAEFHGKQAPLLKSATKMVGVGELVGRLTHLERSATDAGACLLAAIDQMEKVNAKP